MKYRSSLVRAVVSGVLAGVAAPLGCASTVDSAPTLADGGTLDDRASLPDGGPGDDSGAGRGACVAWALTDEENTHAGALATDDHRTFDAAGRLARQEWDLDAAGVARSVVRWERDAEGRVARRTDAEGRVSAAYAYAVTATQIEVTMTAGESRTLRRYRCLPAPARFAPADPQPILPLPSTSPQVEQYPEVRSGP